MTDLVESMKKIAIMAVESTDPVKIQYGLVESAEPLRIRIDQKRVLDTESLILSGNLQERIISVPAILTIPFYFNPEDGSEDGSDDDSEDDEEIESEESWSDKLIKTNITLEIPSPLDIGDAVIMLQKQGGQMFYVADKLDNAPPEFIALLRNAKESAGDDNE